MALSIFICFFPLSHFDSSKTRPINLISLFLLYSFRIDSLFSIFPAFSIRLSQDLVVVNYLKIQLDLPNAHCCRDALLFICQFLPIFTIYDFFTSLIAAIFPTIFSFSALVFDQIFSTTFSRFLKHLQQDLGDIKCAFVSILRLIIQQKQGQFKNLCLDYIYRSITIIFAQGYCHSALYYYTYILLILNEIILHAFGSAKLFIFGCALCFGDLFVLCNELIAQLSNILYEFIPSYLNQMILAEYMSQIILKLFLTDMASSRARWSCHQYLLLFISILCILFFYFLKSFVMKVLKEKQITRISLQFTQILRQHESRCNKVSIFIEDRCGFDVNRLCLIFDAFDQIDSGCIIGFDDIGTHHIDSFEGKLIGNIGILLIIG